MQGSLSFPDDDNVPENPVPEQPIVRKSDPPTSHEAAAGTEDKLSLLHIGFLAGLRALGVPSTSEEIAVKAAELHPGSKAQSYRKRTAELVRANRIKVVGERPCAHSGKNCRTFWLA